MGTPILEIKYCILITDILNYIKLTYENHQLKSAGKKGLKYHFYTQQERFRIIVSIELP